MVRKIRYEADSSIIEADKKPREMYVDELIIVRGRGFGIFLYIFNSSLELSLFRFDILCVCFCLFLTIQKWLSVTLSEPACLISSKHSNERNSQTR